MDSLISTTLPRLGRHPARLDPRVLRMAAYLPPAAQLAPAPASCSWLSNRAEFGMLANDVLGNCTIAGVAHALQVWSDATGPWVDFTDAQVVDYYRRWAGYAGSPDTDNGANELDILNRWRNSPDGFLGWKLRAYADPDPHNDEHVRQAIWRFGLLYIGLGLPLTAQNQTIWDYVPGQGSKSQPWSWGGHCVIVAKYDANFLYAVTWGGVQRMTWEFWHRYCDESHALLSEIWADRAGADFNLPGLDADLVLVTA